MNGLKGPDLACRPFFHTSGVNFINVKRTNFLYECRVLAAFSSYMYVEKRHLYEKLVRKMLMKLTPGVNFINILRTSFLNESKLSSFSLVTFGFVIF